MNFTARVLCAILLVAVVNHARAAEPVLLGAPTYVPTADHPVGWRGDWTGKYPGATPPLEWSIGKDLKGKNVAWVTQLPMYCGGSGASSPIVVGDRIYFCIASKDAGLGPVSLCCVNLNDGKILWLRPLTEYDVASDDDRKKVQAAVDPLRAALEKNTAALVDALNKRTANQGDWHNNAVGHFIDPGWGINAQFVAADKAHYKMADRNDWGYASAAPCSDGKFVYVWFSNRIAACFDLDGKLIWATMEPAALRGAGEHGSHASPVLLPDRFVVMYGTLVIAFDKKTGKVLWTSEAEGSWGLPQSSLTAAKLSDGWLIMIAQGQGLRADTGVSLWGKFGGYAGENTTPVIENGMFATYERSGISTFKLPGAIAGGTLTTAAAYKFATQFVDYQIASPLIYNGLVYCVNETGKLRVFDPASQGAILYEQQLELKGEHGWVGAPGVSASPAIAGKNLYVMDNQGTMVVLEPGRTYKPLAHNLSESGDQMVVSPVFSGKKIIMRGQQNLYCISAP